ncbi:MAG: segregation and condensation protein A, partial [Acidimicrobiales bacterium]
MPYEVSTAVFEGPFDLLLHLIASQQVDLYEVNLADIVDAFLVELDRMVGLDLEVATEFALIASTLIELKCRRLLPGRDDVELDEEVALWEQRDLLLARLLECKTFKDAALALVGLANHAQCSVPRRSGPDCSFDRLMPDIMEGISPERLRRAALVALSA